MIVTLINPPNLYRKSNAATVMPPPPIGLAYVAGMISKDFEVTVIDAIGEALEQKVYIQNSNYYYQGLTIDDILSRIPNETAIIGMTCMFSSNWLFHKHIINLIIEKFPKSKIVLGGEHATAAAEDILKEYREKIICILGEGEETFLDYCLSLKNSAEKIDSVRGIAYYKNGEVHSSRRERIKLLDEIPWPKWDLFPIDNYLNLGVCATVHNKKSMVMLTSRGCPYKCSFCSAPVMWDKYVFHRKPEEIIREIRFYIEKYQINHIEFMDLVGLVNKNWTLDFCKKMKDAKLPITFTFSPGTRSEILSREVLQGLKDAKLLRIQYAPDSGSTEEAKLLKKNANLEKMTESISNSVELGLPICSNILIGFPGQKLSSLFDTAIFCLKLAYVGVDDVLIHNFVPYSGSEFQMKLKNDPEQKYKNFISDEYMVKTSTPSLGLVKSYSDEIPSWFLSFFRLTLLFLCLITQYIFHPKRILKTISNLFRQEPITYFENLIYLKLFASNLKIDRKSQVKIESFEGLK